MQSRVGGKPLVLCSDFQWESNQTLTQTDGGQTPLILLDNEFEITGDANGTNRNGEEYTVEITSPIVKKKNCRWFVSGVVELVVDNKTLSLDYGNGICDQVGDLTLPNGQVVQIQVRRSW